jgi:signal transduction histidine kinase
LTRDEAHAHLLNGSSSQRLAAARWLAEHASPDDSQLIKQGLASQPDHWVFQALHDAQGRLRTTTVAVPPVHDMGDLDDPTIAVADAYARGLRDTTSTLVHELRRFVGFAKLSAGAEVTGYEDSETRKDLERLSSLLDAIELLGMAAESLSIDEFDLTELVLETIAREADAFNIEILDRGPRPFLVLGDRRLLELAVRTALINACEAILEFGSTSDRSIVVAWDRTERDVWVAVIDEGPGLPDDLVDPFEFATTTKNAERHLGVGLAVARRAAMTLGGRAELRQGPLVGATFEVRWPQP